MEVCCILCNAKLPEEKFGHLTRRTIVCRRLAHGLHPPLRPQGSRGDGRRRCAEASCELSIALQKGTFHTHQAGELVAGVKLSKEKCLLLVMKDVDLQSAHECNGMTEAKSAPSTRLNAYKGYAPSFIWWCAEYATRWSLVLYFQVGKLVGDVGLLGPDACQNLRYSQV